VPVASLLFLLLSPVFFIWSGMSIDLQRGSYEASIWKLDFEWSVSLDSKAMIRDYMKLNDRLTRDIQDHFLIEGREGFEKNVKSWLKSGLNVKLLPGEGPMEWRPPSKVRGPRPVPWKITGDYGIGNTYNEDPAYFWGDKFEYANFETDEMREGVAIAWEGMGTSPEVYMGGGFEDFMASQRDGDPFSYETFLHNNEVFENGFMWAWEKLGVFGDPEFSRRQDEQTKGVLKAIEKDPVILLPESVEKILLKFDQFPVQIQKAVQWLMSNHRRDIEKALGQKLIWVDLYGQ
jgi:hypothetical protein